MDSRNLARNPSYNMKKIRAMYEKIDIHDLIKQQIMNDESAINK